MFGMETLDAFQEGRVLLIDKPLNWTSFQVVNKIRWLIKQQFNIKKIKVGHAGTLDPLATGLLILCTGKLQKNRNLSSTSKRIYGYYHIRSYHTKLRFRIRNR